MSPTIENLNDPAWWADSAPKGATHWGEDGYFYKRNFSDHSDSWPMKKWVKGFKAWQNSDIALSPKLHKRPDHSVDTTDMVGQKHDGRKPKQERYQDKKGEDFLDECMRTMTPEQFRGAMMFTIGKYIRRLGRKDDIAREVYKIADYSQRWLEYEKSLEKYAPTR